MKEYEESFADCYVLTKKRTESFIEEFLDHFVPDRREMADSGDQRPPKKGAGLKSLMSKTIN